MFYSKKKGSTSSKGSSFMLILIALYFLFPQVSNYIKDMTGQIPVKESIEKVTKDKSLIDILDKTIDSISRTRDTEDVEFTNLEYNLEEALAMLEKIEIKEPIFDTSKNGKSDYNRKDFETPRRKFNSKHDGKSLGIRNYILEETIGKKHTEDFIYKCPYTAEELTIDKSIDYDHIVPLAYTFGHGGSSWSNEKKNDYSYDFSVGILTSASSNRAKGAKGPGEWMPEINRKWYSWKWLEICSKYDLSISKKDYEAIKKALNE